VVNANGSFTYTPTATARHGAAKSGALAADKADSFTVTIADGYGGTTTSVVSVAISPTNTAPVAGISPAGTANGSTGAITGTVSATDANSDTLTYSGSTTTAQGTVVVNANGSYTYTPTSTARDQAGATRNTVTSQVSGLAQPWSLALSPDGSRAYVTDIGSGTLKVIDTATNTIIASIGVGFTSGVAVSPDGTTVYVTNSSNGTMSVVDTATNAVTRTYSGLNSPSRVFVTPDGTKIYVADDGGALRMVDTKANSLSVITTGLYPSFVAVNQNVTRAYAANPVNETVSVIDLSTKAVTTISGMGKAAYVAVSPDGTRAYVIQRGSNYADTIAVLDTATNTVTATIPVAGSLSSLAISPDGKNAYSTQSGQWGDGSMSVIDLNSNIITSTTTGLFGPTSIAVSPDGTRAYVVANGLSVVTLRTTDTFNVTVSDGHGGSAVVPVTVTVAPVNSAPVAGTTTIGAPNATTGVITGSVPAADVDGNTLTYSTPTTTSKGSVSLNANTGAFTYTPTTTARHAAAKNGADQSAGTDGFTITVSDGQGGTIAIPVNVTVTSSNSAPTAASPTVNNPGPLTGIVTGSISGTDADGDAVSYSGTTTTSQGTVTVNSDGTFSYAPTDIARNDATANTTDTFALTISDGYGGVTAVPVTVKVSPNKTPTPKVTVGVPNPTTGLVTGSVAATDGDNDTLTYTVATSSSKGTVDINSSTGVFTYTPSTLGRHNAAYPQATAADKADAFIVTVSDGRGGVVLVPVTVAVRPKNSDPTATVNVGELDAATGVITGTVAGSDADADTLTYSAPGATVSGRVTIDSRTGAFTYTPLTRADTVTAVITGFQSPSAVAFSPDGQRAYVSDSKANSVSVIDTATRTVVGTIGGLTKPTDLAVAPDGKHMYVVSTGTVSIVDTATNAVTDTIAGLYSRPGYGAEPRYVEFSPDGTIAYVVNSYDAISVVDTESNAVTAKITVYKGESLGHVVFSPDGTRAYASLYSSFRVIDVATDSIRRSAYGNQLAGAGNVLAVSRDGSRIYGVQTYGSTYVYDTTLPDYYGYDELRRFASVDERPGYVLSSTLSRDGSLLYALGYAYDPIVGRYTNELYLFDTATNTYLLNTVQSGCDNCGSSDPYNVNYTYDIAVSPDGTNLYVVGLKAGSVSIVTPGTGQKTDSFDVTISDGYGATTTVPVTVSYVG
jgi:YVTN family beta-propeller protein/VCBS repeat-containing protein